jgi:hypothetical protein
VLGSRHDGDFLGEVVCGEIWTDSKYQELAGGFRNQDEGLGIGLAMGRYASHAGGRGKGFPDRVRDIGCRRSRPLTSTVDVSGGDRPGTARQARWIIATGSDGRPEQERELASRSTFRGWIKHLVARWNVTSGPTSIRLGLRRGRRAPERPGKHGKGCRQDAGQAVEMTNASCIGWLDESSEWA